MQPSTWYLPLCHSNPIQGIPLTTVTTSHVIKGRLQIHNTVRYGRQVGFMGGLTSPKWYVCSTWPCSATFIQSSHQRVKPNKNFSSHIVLYTMLWHLKQIYPTSLDLFSPLYFAHTHTLNHTHTHTHNHTYLRNMQYHNNECVDILPDYTVHCLPNITNHLYAYSTHCMCRCVIRKHFSLHASLNIPQTHAHSPLCRHWWIFKPLCCLNDLINTSLL